MSSRIVGTVAPAGKHLMSMFCQYAPYALENGTWDEKTREEFATRCFDVVERYAPGFKNSIIDRQVLRPDDIESIFTLSGVNIFQGAMSVDNLYALRPAAGNGQSSTTNALGGSPSGGLPAFGPDDPMPGEPL